MQLEVTKIIKELDGTESIDAKGKPITARTILCDALLVVTQETQNISGDEKLKQWELAQKIYKQDSVEISVEEGALLKKLIGKSYGPLVVGQIYELIK